MDGTHVAAGRVGLVGHGVYHLLLTLLCGRLLLGGSGEEAGARGAIATVARQPFGQVLLTCLTIAFAAYAATRWIRVVRRDGAGTKAANALRASVWTFLSVLGGNAVRTGLQASGAAVGDSTGTSITRTVLELPAGPWVVGAVGLLLVGVALHQARRAVNGSLSHELEELGLDERRAARLLGRAGYAGRALAYGAVAAFVVHAAATHDPQAGRGLDGALREAQQTTWGPWLLLAVTIGFAAFGLFRLTEARYARDPR